MSKDLAVKFIGRYAEFCGRGEAWPELKVRLDEFLDTVSPYPLKSQMIPAYKSEAGITSFSMRFEIKLD